jgi:hypothetical protein
MKRFVIKTENREPIVIIITDVEIKSAARFGVTEMEYIKEKAKITIEQELKEKNTWPNEKP